MGKRDKHIYGVYKRNNSREYATAAAARYRDCVSECPTASVVVSDRVKCVKGAGENGN